MGIPNLGVLPGLRASHSLRCLGAIALCHEGAERVELMILRSWRERVLQTLLYEAGGLAVVLPLYALATGHSAVESLTVLVAVSITCMLWAGLHNTSFDVVENYLSKRLASDRTQGMRMVHAASLEVTSIIVTTPVIMLMAGLSLWDALLVDIGLTVAYSAYAYIFHMVFDHYRPITVQPQSMAFAGTSAAAFTSTPKAQRRARPQTKKFGVHIMLDGYGAPEGLLRDEVYLRRLLDDLPGIIGMHVIAAPQTMRFGPFNLSNPDGISGYVLIAEGHVSFHTFPDRGFVTIDLCTCQNNLDRQSLVGLLKRAFHFTEADLFVQERGLRYPGANLAA